MGFNWKSAVGTIIPTVGSILGKMLGVSASDGALLYQFADTETDGCEACIVKRDGHIKLWNRSEDENALITLSLPRVGALEPQTVTLRSGESVEMDSFFADCANHDSTKIMLTASNSTEAVKRGINGAGEQFHICAAASDVKADGNTPVRLGSYLTVVCSGDRAIFTSTNHQIINFDVANFQGRNDQRIKVMDIPAVKQDGGTVVEVQFPSPFPAGTVLDIDVEVEMGGLSNILAEQRKWCTVQRVDEEEAKVLRSIPIIR